MKVLTSKICLALLVLAGLFGTGCETNKPRIFRHFYLPPLQISAAKMDDPLFPDKRRQGVNEVVVRPAGRRGPYTGKYIQLAQNDADYTVRAIAVRALNRSRDASADPVFIRALSDDQPLVRLEAAKALNRLPDPSAVPLLIVHLQPTYDTGNFDDTGRPIQQDEIQDVRIAAAEALAHYKALNVARALVDMLDSRDFGIASEARTSLRAITGQDFAYDQGAWLNYLTNHSLG
jgi:HEAT repeat protein